MRVPGELMGDASPLMMPGNIPQQINGLVPSSHSITTIITLTSELNTSWRERSRGGATKCQIRCTVVPVDNVPGCDWIRNHTCERWRSSAALVSNQNQKQIKKFFPSRFRKQQQHQQPCSNICHKRVQCSMLHLCISIFSIPLCQHSTAEGPSWSEWTERERQGARGREEGRQCAVLLR